MDKIVEAIRDLYPEAIGIYLVGSVAREEAHPESDIDILILFSDDQDQWQMVRRDQPLWRDFPTIHGRNIDFIIRTESGPTVGQFRYRERLGLPNPMTPLWEAK